MRGSLEEAEPDPASHVNADHPANAGVLRYLRHRNERGRPLCEPPEAVSDPYLTLGSHPDIVERVWSGLRAAGAFGPSVVLGTPALTTCSSGVVMAVALGTSYALRAGSEAEARAIDEGRRLRHRYGRNGPTLDLPSTFGPGWVFGAFDVREHEWLARAAAALS